MSRGVVLPEEKQKQIKELLREGKTYNEIAAELDIAVNSVGNFLRDETIRAYLRKTGRL